MFFSTDGVPRSEEQFQKTNACGLAGGKNVLFLLSALTMDITLQAFWCSFVHC
jgi:hypothetical protein